MGFSIYMTRKLSYNVFVTVLTCFRHAWPHTVFESCDNLIRELWEQREVLFSEWGGRISQIPTVNPDFLTVPSLCDPYLLSPREEYTLCDPCLLTPVWREIPRTPFVQNYMKYECIGLHGIYRIHVFNWEDKVKLLLSNKSNNLILFQTHEDFIVIIILPNLKILNLKWYYRYLFPDKGH